MEYITIEVNEKKTNVQALLLEKNYIVNCTKDVKLLTTSTGEHSLLPSGIQVEMKVDKHISFGKEIAGMPTVIFSKTKRNIILPESQGNTLYYVDEHVFKEAIKNGRSDVITRHFLGNKKIEDEIVTHLTCGWQTEQFQKLLLEKIIFNEYNYSNNKECIFISHIDEKSVTINYKNQERRFEFKNLLFEEIK